MKRDPLAALRLADPARRYDLDAVDDRALETLRQAITMTPGTTPRQSRPKRGRRIVAVAAAATVFGGGIAYATYSTMFAGGANDGVTCMTTFVDPDRIDVQNNPTFGGSGLTADPIADCATYAAKAGVPAIKDPVAFRYHGYTLVTPASEVPEGAELIARPDAVAQERKRVQWALDDLVDRPSACMTAAQASAFAQFALKETGLTGWTVDAVADDTDGCFFPMTDETQQVILLRSTPTEPAELPPGAEVFPLPGGEDSKYAAIDAQSAVMFEALRTGISEGCLGLADAERLAGVQAAEADRVTREALGPVPGGTPVFAERDDALACSTVDILPGGEFVIFVRGPEVAKG